MSSIQFWFFRTAIILDSKSRYIFKFIKKKDGGNRQQCSHAYYVLYFLNALFDYMLCAQGIAIRLGCRDCIEKPNLGFNTTYNETIVSFLVEMLFLPFSILIVKKFFYERCYIILITYLYCVQNLSVCLRFWQSPKYWPLLPLSDEKMHPY